MVTFRLVVGSVVDSGRGSFQVSAAASGRGVHWLALDLDVGLLRGAGRGPGAHPLLDLGRHGHEGLLHVGGALGAGLQEGDPQVVGKFLEEGEEEGEEEEGEGEAEEGEEEEEEEGEEGEEEGEEEEEELNEKPQQLSSLHLRRKTV